MNFPMTIGMIVLSVSMLGSSVLADPQGALFSDLSSYVDESTGWYSDTFGIESFRGERQEVNVANITSDADSGNSDMKLALDDHLNIVGFRLLTSSGNNKDIPLNSLSKGVVLMNARGYDVLKLLSVNFNPSTGGKFQLIYLENAILNHYGKFEMTLTRSGNHWFLQSNGREFSNMFLKGKKVLGNLVGIEAVQVH